MPSYDVADTLMAPFAIRHCAVAVPVKLPVPVTVSVYVPTAVPVFPLTVNVTGSPSTVTPATDCVNSAPVYASDAPSVILAPAISFRATEYGTVAVPVKLPVPVTVNT